MWPLVLETGAHWKGVQAAALKNPALGVDPDPALVPHHFADTGLGDVGQVTLLSEPQVPTHVKRGREYWP